MAIRNSLLQALTVGHGGNVALFKNLFNIIKYILINKICLCLVH